MVDDIRNLLFTLLLNHALNKHFTCIDHTNEDILIEDTIKSLCEQKELCYLSGAKITIIPKEFESLFYDFELLKKSNDFQTQLQILIKKIKQRQFFTSELKRVNQFFLNANGQITKQDIQEHFYNTIADELLQTTTIIPLEDIKSREPYIYLAVTSLAVLKTVIMNLNEPNGFLLFKKQRLNFETIFTIEKEYQKFLFALIELRKYILLTNTKEEHDLIRLYCLNNPDLEIAPSILKTPFLMQIVSIINGIACDVSSLKDFKNNIENVFHVLG